MKVYAVGASRNIGYYATLRLLEKGATVTYLLRSTSSFDTDEVMKRYIASGHARLVKGDALNLEDVAKGWVTAQEGPGALDLVLFTVGGTPKITLKGAAITPVDLTTRSLLNLLRTTPDSLRSAESQPKFIIITSSGVGRESHKNLPLPLKVIYPWMLSGPHADKLGMERVLAHSAGWQWKDEEPREDILPSNWASVQGTPAKAQLINLLVIRPAMLSDEQCRGDSATSRGKVPYRVAEGNLAGNNGYTVSRKDVAHFIVEGALADWGNWQGKVVTIAY